MGKPAVQRQKEYLARLKAKNNDDYLKKERKRKRHATKVEKWTRQLQNVFAEG